MRGRGPSAGMVAWGLHAAADPWKLRKRYCGLQSANASGTEEVCLMDAISRSHVSTDCPRDAAVCLRAHLTDPRTAGVWCRTGQLTPYLAEMIVEDAMHVGSGAHLEVAISPRPSSAALLTLRQRFGWLASRGVQVTLHGDGLAAIRLPHHPRGPAARSPRRRRGPADVAQERKQRKRHAPQRARSNPRPAPAQSRSR